MKDVVYFPISSYTLSMTSLELSELVANQRKFFSTGTTREVNFRKEQLLRLKNALKKHQGEILSALAKDLNKTPVEAFATELAPVYREINYMRRRIPFLSFPKFTWTPLEGFPGFSRIYSEPFGCALIITPWNFPFQIPLMALIAAISSGNCVILKPSNNVPTSEKLLTKLIEETFTKDYVALVTGGTEIHHPLLTQKYDFIFYTGGSMAGKKIMEAAARNLTPVCLEMGGKNPCIVDATADLDLAAKRIIWGKLINSGQTCIAPDYVLVQTEKKPDLIEKMKKYMDQFYGTNPVAADSNLASIVNERHFFRLLNWANGNNPANGTVITGKSTSLSYNKEARKIKPVILDSPALDAPVMQDEIFGPILPVVPFRDINEAILFVQKKPDPLALYLFSKDRSIQKRIIKTLRYGGGCINDVFIHAANHHLPFGGTGASGIGNYHGEAGFHTFSHKKSIHIKLTKIDFPLRYPPYTDKIFKLLKMFYK